MSAAPHAGQGASPLARLTTLRLLVCVGPGGVGKTTVAAALAARAAAEGKRALVLTIDPARRLADALGLDGLDDAVHRVPADLPGELSAAMLDTGKSFDALMHRIGSDAQDVERILENRVYRSFSRTLARSHAYVAMERLYDVVEHGNFDLIVLDTPPLRSALDILDAPSKLVRLLDEDVVRWFLQPKKGALSRLLPGGGALAVRLLGMLASRRLVEETAAFFSVLLHLEEGFRHRAERVHSMLRDATTGFLLVCSPSYTSLGDASYLREGLSARGVELSLTVFNRAYVGEASDPALPVGAREPSLGGQLGAELARLRALVAEANRAQERAMAGFAAELPPHAAVSTLPELERDVRDVPGLLSLAAALGA